MKIVEREHIDVIKWDALVEASPNSNVFSYSWYMDSVAENWCVLVDSNYSKGIALPFSKRAGIEVLYCPIFGMYSEELGGSLSNADLKSIRDRFKIIDFCSKQNIFDSEESRKHQIITSYENHSIGSQAKRSHKKAIKNHEVKCEVGTNKEAVFAIIEEELTGKFQGITPDTIKRLGELFLNAKQRQSLVVFNVVSDEVHGGIVCIESNGKLLYVKGAMEEQLKKDGGMYLAMIHAIDYAKEKNLIFDFGGSNVEGVQKFNKNLGGEDDVYFVHVENNGPMWFKFARKIKARLMGN